MPSGTKPAVSETTNKVISSPWHSLTLHRSVRKTSCLINSWLPLLPLKSQVLLFIFSSWTLGKAYQGDWVCQKLVHLGTGTVTNACREEKGFLCFSVLFSPLRCFQGLERRVVPGNRLNLTQENWTSAWTTSSLGLRLWLSSAGNWDHLSQKSELENPEQLSYPSTWQGENCPLWFPLFGLLEFEIVLQERSALNFLWEFPP